MAFRSSVCNVHLVALTIKFPLTFCSSPDFYFLQIVPLNDRVKLFSSSDSQSNADSLVH